MCYDQLINEVSLFRCVSVLCLQIVQRYDILLIQEIRDKSETSIVTLVDAINKEIGYV